ncbi:MAG: UDP-N-acetylmuramoyl-tripeptide--D-alanyl-D-alanine ligase [Chthoniobacterales bacterium]|nr:UDP-N-acetylmuramoyl-tripeptide--D-alanyl-D-alanine ligase [Chthoniobacterales bacterium]
MNNIPLSQIAIWSQAKLIAGDPTLLVSGVSHDTRTLKPGNLYIAMKGERFDGNDFLLEAAQKGAVGAIIDGEIPENLPTKFGIIRAAHSLEALHSLAHKWRGQLSLRVIALTGSNGKTTTKDFTATVLRTLFSTTSTQGNFNNNIGLPLSILAASPSDQIAVWEIGMNHRHEIAPLAKLAAPDIAIITNIGVAHIGLLGSRQAIAVEKGDLLAVLSKNGVAILPAGDPFFTQLSMRTSAPIISVGINCGVLHAEKIVVTPTGSEFEVHYEASSYKAFLPVFGRHMIHNALLALAAGLCCGVPLERGIQALEKITPSKSRLAIHQVGGVTLVDDSYNANPDSMEAALLTVSTMSCPGRRIGVLGCMRELGHYEHEGYTRVGGMAAKALDILITIGSETVSLVEAAHKDGLKKIYQVNNNQEASDLLNTLLHDGDLVLVKGSLSANLKEVVSKLISAPPKPRCL